MEGRARISPDVLASYAADAAAEVAGVRGLADSPLPGRKGVRVTTLKVAAELLGKAVEDLELDGGLVRVRGGNISIKLGDIAREAVGIPGYSLPKASWEGWLKWAGDIGMLK